MGAPIEIFYRRTTIHLVETIANRIKRLRLARQLTQAQLGVAIARDQSVVSDMERGKAFKIDVLPALCEALGVSIEYLVIGASLDDQTTEATKLFRQLSPDQRESLLAVARTMVPSGRQ